MRISMNVLTIMVVVMMFVSTLQVTGIIAIFKIKSIDGVSVA